MGQKVNPIGLRVGVNRTYHEATPTGWYFQGRH
jgi:hypothetical protein